MASSSTLEIVKALGPYTACDCSDALAKLKYKHCGFVNGPTLWSPKRQEGDTKIVGPAYTVEYALLNDPRPKVANHYIDSVPAGTVVYISSPEVPNAVYGGLMTNRAKTSGAVGTIVHGRIRDLNEHRGQNYPVFARGVSTAPPYETVKVVGVNVPLRLIGDGQDVTVNPGDIVVADTDGVVVVPLNLVEKMVPLIQPQVGADEKMHKAIAGGMSFTEAGKTFRA